MYVLMRKDGWFVHKIWCGGVCCTADFEIERILCFQYRNEALALLTFIDCIYPDCVYDVVYIPDTDPRICDLDLDNFYF